MPNFFPVAESLVSSPGLAIAFEIFPFRLQASPLSLNYVAQFSF